jgi:hypothetical protein
VPNSKLRPWKAGQSGNPKGRPRKGRSLIDALERAVDTDELAQIIWRRAREGEQWACVLLANKLAPEASLRAMAATEGGNLTIEVTYIDRQLNITANNAKAIDAPE